jgi:glycosyltransferase involved in cell wall biosynthesis
MKALCFSFLLCVNRDQPHLQAAVKSVLDQDDQDFEFLIGANACEDALWDKLQGIAAFDRRIRLFRTDIGQLAFNLNLLASEAKGDYLIRMDADDVSLPHRLRTLRAHLHNDPVDILGSSVILIDDASNEIGRMDLPLSRENIVKSLLTRTVFCHPAVTIRRQFLLDMRGYLGGFVSEDTDLWIRASRAGAKMQNLPEPLLLYRVHAGQSIMSNAGYAEVTAHWLRELLLHFTWYNCRGFAFALFKYIFLRKLPGINQYKKK